jgi:hypothetical protein
MADRALNQPNIDLINAIQHAFQYDGRRFTQELFRTLQHSLLKLYPDDLTELLPVVLHGYAKFGVSENNRDDIDHILNVLDVGEFGMEGIDQSEEDRSETAWLANKKQELFSKVARPQAQVIVAWLTFIRDLHVFPTTDARAENALRYWTGRVAAEP